MANVWFSADFHLGHHNIIKYCNRPFDSVEEMNQTIIDNVNAVVKPQDMLYYLGDFCFGSAQDIEKYRKQINCKNIIFVRGNHDKQIPRDCFLSVQDIAVYKGQTDIVLCHYAMRVWNKKHYGTFHLYGHSHGTLPGLDLSFDCGVDTNDFKPYSLYDVECKMAELQRELNG